MILHGSAFATVRLSGLGRVCVFSIVLSALIPHFFVTVRAADKTAEPTPACGVGPGGPYSYCGLQSLYLAMRALDKDIQFRDLLRPQYIGSKQGSSLTELIQAARDHGMNAEAVVRMTCSLLQQADCPVILHVKSHPAATNFDHWVLFMGVEDGRAKIYDGAGPCELVPFADVSAVWDGIGVFVSTEPFNHLWVWLALISDLIVYLGLAAVLATGLISLQDRWRRRPAARASSSTILHSLREAGVLALIVILLIFTFSLLNWGGSLSSPMAVAGIQDAHLGNLLPKVNVHEINRLSHSPTVTIVDARHQKEYEQGHIDGAICIAIDADIAACQKALRGVPYSNRIIIYCQSSGCPYSEIVAGKLRSVGYKEIALFQEGWLGWEKLHKDFAALQ